MAIPEEYGVAIARYSRNTKALIAQLDALYDRCRHLDDGEAGTTEGVRVMVAKAQVVSRSDVDIPNRFLDLCSSVVRDRAYVQGYYAKQVGQPDFDAEAYQSHLHFLEAMRQVYGFFHNDEQPSVTRRPTTRRTRYTRRTRTARRSEDLGKDADPSLFRLDELDFEDLGTFDDQVSAYESYQLNTSPSRKGPSPSEQTTSQETTSAAEIPAEAPSETPTSPKHLQSGSNRTVTSSTALPSRPSMSGTADVGTAQTAELPETKPHVRFGVAPTNSDSTSKREPISTDATARVIPQPPPSKSSLRPTNPGLSPAVEDSRIKSIGADTQDLTETLNELHELWKSYGKGHISIVLAAPVTDIAHELLGEVEERLWRSKLAGNPLRDFTGGGAKLKEVEERMQFLTATIKASSVHQWEVQDTATSGLRFLDTPWAAVKHSGPATFDAATALQRHRAMSALRNFLNATTSSGVSSKLPLKELRSTLKHIWKRLPVIEKDFDDTCARFHIRKPLQLDPVRSKYVYVSNPDPPWAPLPYLKRHPLLIGTELFLAKHYFHKLSIQWAEQSTIPAAMAHLYHLLRSVDLVPPWPAMDAVIEISRVEYLCLPPAGKHVEPREIVSNYLELICIRPKSLERRVFDLRPFDQYYATCEPRPRGILPSRTPILDEYSDWLVGDTPHPEWHKRINDLMDASLRDHDCAVATGTSPLRKAKSGKVKSPTAQKVFLLRKHLTAELPLLDLPIADITCISINLVHDLQRYLTLPSFPEWAAYARTFDGAASLHFIAYIFMNVYVGVSKKRPLGGNEMLRECGRIWREGMVSGVREEGEEGKEGDDVKEREGKGKGKGKDAEGKGKRKR